MNWFWDSWIAYWHVLISSEHTLNILRKCVSLYLFVYHCVLRIEIFGSSNLKLNARNFIKIYTGYFTTRLTNLQVGQRRETDMIRNKIVMQGRKCRNWTLQCKEAGKNNINSNTLMGQKTLYWKVYARRCSRLRTAVVR